MVLSESIITTQRPRTAYPSPLTWGADLKQHKHLTSAAQLDPITIGAPTPPPHRSTTRVSPSYVCTGWRRLGGRELGLGVVKIRQHYESNKMRFGEEKSKVKWLIGSLVQKRDLKQHKHLTSAAQLDPITIGAPTPPPHRSTTRVSPSYVCTGWRRLGGRELGLGVVKIRQHVVVIGY
nr:hypothetical protein [Tanacetum cinerariifolium]